MKCGWNEKSRDNCNDCLSFGPGNICPAIVVWFCCRQMNGRSWSFCIISHSWEPSFCLSFIVWLIIAQKVNKMLRCQLSTDTTNIRKFVTLIIKIHFKDQQCLWVYRDDAIFAAKFSNIWFKNRLAAVSKMHAANSSSSDPSFSLSFDQQEFLRILTSERFLETDSKVWFFRKWARSLI